MTEIRFRATVDDLIAAQRLYQRAALPRYFKLIGVAAIIIILLFLLRGAMEDMVPLLSFVALAIVVMVLIPAIAYFWTIPRMAKKAIRHDAALSEEAVMRWDGSMISAESGSASWSQPIASFAGWQANDAILLLFRQTHLFHFIPTRAFPDAETRQALIAALTANGVTTQWPPK